MWLTQIKTVPDDERKVGETYELPDGEAKILIKVGFAKAAPTPPEVSGVKLDSADLADVVGKTVDACFSKLAPVGKRFNTIYGVDETPKTKEWATLRRSGRMKNFTNDDNGREQAYRFGHWMRAAMYQSSPGSLGFCKRSFDWCDRQGMKFFEMIEEKTNGQLEGVNSLGGFLVPIEFDNMLIDLREKYGVFRRSCNMTPMSGDTKTIPRRLAGPTAYYATEGSAVTESVKTWDNVQLVARKLMCLVRYSNELGEDAILNIGDDLAGEIAYQFALKEDQAGFFGTGVSTYGGITGVATALFNLNSNTSYILGLTVGAAGTGASYNGFTLANFNRVVGTLPQYAGGPNAKWYTSQYFWGSVMQRLATAAGGNRVGNIVDGVQVPMFLGYEVVISQVFPNAEAVNQVVCLFGDLSKSTSFGDRRTTAIKVSDVAFKAFEQDQIVIRGTERFDIVAHDVGELTPAGLIATGTTARDPNYGPLAGPITALATASS